MKTVSDAVQKLGVSKARVHWFIRNGRLRARQTSGGLWTIEPAELARFARIPRPTGRPKKNSRSRLAK